MKAYVSLHTAEPKSQADHEIAYKGYARILIDNADDLGKKPITVSFPAIEEYFPEAVTHVCIAPEDMSQLMIVRLEPLGPMIVGREPKVVFANIPEPLPNDLHPIALVAWNLINERQLDAATLHPKLYEAINDELHRVGVPVLKVTREGVAKMDIKFDQMPSLRKLETVGNA